MKALIILDSGGVLLLAAPILFAVFLAIIVYVESWILSVFIEAPYKKLWIQSLIANLASLGTGLLMIPVLDDKIGGVEDLPTFLVATLIVETTILYFFNRTVRFRLILYGSVLMNLITYFILFLMMWF